MRAFIDLTGKRFGKWVVLGVGGRTKNNQIMWNCLCDCGTNKDVRGGDLREGKSKGCGCDRSESTIKFNKETKLKHGMSKHRLYGIHTKMMDRCYKPDNQDYRNYGGRGITVQYSWHDIRNFVEDMYSSYTEGYTIERLDNDKNYCLENCTWIPNEDQARHTRKQHNNTSGVTGVYITPQRSGVVALWREDGKARKKYFNANILGFDEAFKLAVEYRETMIQRLREKGVAYHPDHGK